MSNKKPNLITLPTGTDMLKRFGDVSDNPCIVRNFYPLLAAHAGREMSADDVVAMFKSAVEACSKEMTSGVKRKLKSILPLLITAIIDDVKTTNHVMCKLRRADIIK